ncbi:MAG: Flp pilus assembly complex ATPase component TadA [Solobacterium sp.]|nr:Flp pilus assembly complex ATPase component TadA [Solobacterium sp.]
MENDLIRCLEIALKYHVTDIHFSVMENNQLKVEMRIKNRMFRLKDVQLDIHFFRYLMYRANLDSSDLQKPQTGQFSLAIQNHSLSLRFSILSSFRMISGVLRILNNHVILDSKNLSLTPSHGLWFQQLPSYTNGLVVFSGPTGSGKTTTLYTILNHVKQKKIYTIEDPIEVYSNHYVQIQINEKHHLSYQEALKQLMRQDPDIIMIGEIRDPTAAEIAIRASLTGHLVVTSLHASSCIGAIHRLLDLGIKEYQLKDVLRGISNQRLFDTPMNTKIGAYEIMDEQEVNYYFKHKTTSPSFIPLEKTIQEALLAKTIQEEKDPNSI